MNDIFPHGRNKISNPENIRVGSSANYLSLLLLMVPGSVGAAGNIIGFLYKYKDILHSCLIVIVFLYPFNLTKLVSDTFGNSEKLKEINFTFLYIFHFLIILDNFISRKSCYLFTTIDLRQKNLTVQVYVEDRNNQYFCQNAKTPKELFKYM